MFGAPGTSRSRILSAFFIVGGAGFIGSHFVERLLQDASVTRVTIYDNMSSGREWHFADKRDDKRFAMIRGDAKDLPKLAESMAGHDTVIHLASNPDISKARTKPDIDFYEGTLLSHQVVEAMRLSGAKAILYASGSGVYGDLGETEAFERDAIGQPISTYGASKMAGETLISAYCALFGMRGRAFRFGNVVGPRQTHGVAFDFIRKLIADPTRLEILGNGTQSKSYIHVDDTIDAVLTAYRNAKPVYDVYNVATGDYTTVTEIAELVVECLGLDRRSVKFYYGDTPRGWEGDIPVVRLSTEHIRALGWRCKRSSREAVRHSIMGMIDHFRAGRMDEATRRVS
jgi:UDP-glucose 4-epimerase